MPNLLLDSPLILKTRRNHALEHATLHILAQKYPARTLAGHSNPSGFFLLGDAPTEEVQAAVDQALTRLQGGERGLAIHAGCGTNFAVSALLAGTLAWLGLAGAKSTRARLWRLPFALALGLLGFLVGRPLGPILQARLTTEADPGRMQVVQITPIRRGRFVAHRIITR